MDAFVKINKDGWSAERLLYEFASNEEAFPSDKRRAHPVLHTAVNRLSGTALTGHLFERGEVVHQGLIDVYFDVRDSEWLSFIDEALVEMAKNGFGAKITAGKGRFAVETGLRPVETEPFVSKEEATYFMSLSSFVPVPGQLAYWQARRTIVKRGKLGPIISDDKASEAAAKPWKKPVFMLAPGTVYHPNEDVELVGKAMGGLASAFPEATQFAYAAGIGVSLAR